jgi:hypothetical protein
MNKLHKYYSLKREVHNVHFLTHVGKNWNQLVYELSGWHRLGRDLEDALNDKENRAFEPVQ